MPNRRARMMNKCLHFERGYAILMAETARRWRRPAAAPQGPKGPQAPAGFAGGAGRRRLPPAQMTKRREKPCFARYNRWAWPGSRATR